MVNVSLITKKVGELHKEAKEIEKLGIEVLDAAAFDGKYLQRPDYRTPAGDMQREVIQRYQRWYAIMWRLVDEFTPEWHDAFQGYYTLKNRSAASIATNGVLDYLMLNTHR